MTFQGAALSGFVSRSSRSIREHRNYRDGYSKQKQFQEKIRIDQRKILEAQRRGFRYRSTGQLEWLDLLRPLAASLQGFERRDTGGEDAIGPVTRWYRTNTFYRRPAVTEKIRAQKGEQAFGLPPIEAGAAFLPGPYTLTRLVDNAHYARPEDLAADYLEAIAGQAASLRERGYEAILFLEPSFGYDLSMGKLEAELCGPGCFIPLREAGFSVGVHFSLADGSLAAPLVEGSGADWIGVDLLYTKIEAVESGLDIHLGVVDGARIAVETPGEILREVERFLSESGFQGNFTIGPNDRLSDVPFEEGLQKIEALAQAALRLGGDHESD